MNIGTEFENDLAKELGLHRVSGSGNQWHNQLDVKGRGTRWSLKATAEEGFRIDRKMLIEALNVVSTTGEVPIWAVRIPAGDFITMRKEDWIRFLQEGEFTIPLDKTAAKRLRANTPQLLRED